MSRLQEALEELDLQQYLQSFLDEGFDTWETVLEIQESDLDALNVKLGHRRRLQRAIANAKGVSMDQLLRQNSSQGALLDEPVGCEHGSPLEEAQRVPPGVVKRRYRRHPKPDENAPKRPPSAYVIFSNRMREELKSLDLSFTEIAKTVGERWQELDPQEKERYEAHATSAKDQYNADMTKYKKTRKYRDYMEYLDDFKSKQAGAAKDIKKSETTGAKRLRLETDSDVSQKSGGRPNIAPWPTLDSAAASDASTSRSSPSASAVRGPLATRHASSTSPVTSPFVAPQHSHTSGRSSPQSHRGSDASKPLLPAIHTLTQPVDLSDYGAFRGLHNQPSQGESSTPRRTRPVPGGRDLTSLLRHDTTKSSISSNISNYSHGSMASSAGFSPITPIDTAEKDRMLQAHLPSFTPSGPPHTLPPAPAGSSFSPQVPGMPPGPARAPPTHAMVHRAGSAENEASLQRLSINTPVLPPSLTNSRSTSMINPSDQYMQSIGSRPNLPPITQPTPQPGFFSPVPLHSNSIPPPSSSLGNRYRGSQYDGLSVLALAGRMVDEEHVQETPQYYHSATPRT